MPTLPRYQPAVRPTADQSVVRLPTPQADTAVADAVGEASRAGFEFAERVQKAKLDNELTTADRLARESIDKTRFEIENDHSIPEEEVAPRLRAATDKIIAASADTISSTSARKGWVNRAQTWAGEGDLWAAKLVRTRQVDGVKAGIIASTADLDAKAGDLGQSAETYATSVQQAKDNVTRHVASGFISPEVGAQQIAELNKLGVKDVTLRTSANIDALVKDGRVAEAQALLTNNASRIDPQTRDRLQAGLAAQALAAQGVTEADRLMAEAKGDFAKFTQAAAKIENPLLRAEVIKNGDQLRQLANKAKADREEAAADAVFDHVLKGGKIANAPPDLLAMAGADKLGSIRAFEDARDREAVMSPAAKAAAKAKSDADTLTLYGMGPTMLVAGPEGWAPEDRELFAGLTSEDQNKVRADIQKRRETGQTADAADKIKQDLLNQAVRVVPAGWNLGENKKRSPDGKLFEGILYGYAQKKAREKGGEPVTIPEARELVARAITDFAAKKGRNPGKIGGDDLKALMDESANAGAGPIANLMRSADPDTWNSVKAALRRRDGTDPTDAEVAAQYQRLLGMNAETVVGKALNFLGQGLAQ